MKKNHFFGKKAFRTVGALVAAGMLLGGCGSSNYASDSTASKNTAESYYEGAAEESYVADYDYSTGGSVNSYDDVKSGAETPEVKESSAKNSRKLIRRVNMSVETKEFDLLIDKLQQDTLDLGGYIETSNVYNNSYSDAYYYNRSASMTLRIPKDKLDGFLTEISNICNVVNRSESVEDVTLAYVDVESHKKALQVEYDQLLDFLGQATSIEDMIYIEERMTNVRYQLESMESQLRTYDNKIDYSTISVSISEVKELTVIEEPVEKTVLQRIGEGFMESLKTVGNGLLEFFIWFVTNIPFLLVWAVIIFIIVVILRAIFGKKAAQKRLARLEAKEAKKARKMQEKEARKANRQAQKGQKKEDKKDEFPVERVSNPDAELTTAAENAKKEQEN